MIDSPSGFSWRRGWSSLTNSNFRKYILGQSVSHTGQWLQQTAELWVILELTGSGIALGLHAVLRHTPTVLLGAYGGLLGDRVDRRKLLIITQALHALAAGILTLFYWIGSPSLALIYSVVLAQGIVNSIDNPLRRGFVRDLVSNAELSNAVSINGIVSTVSRTFGPAIAGIIISTLSATWAFGLNTVSYAAVLASLFTLNVSQMRKYAPVSRHPGQIREGFRYAWGQPRIRRTLVISAIVSVFAWNWSTLLPVYSTTVLGGDAALYGILVSLLSAGSLVAALVTSWMQRASGRHLFWTGLLLSASLLLTAVAPTLALALIGIICIGATGTTFTIGAQTRLQLNVTDEMNARVMAMYSVSWVGSRPVGGILGGWLMDATNARVAFSFGAVAVAVAVIAARVAQRAKGW